MLTHRLLSGLWGASVRDWPVDPFPCPTRINGRKSGPMGLVQERKLAGQPTLVPTCSLLMHLPGVSPEDGVREGEGHVGWC